ncbi:RING/U-box superfamily protein [Forsythia ovata]|uniref:E3 ubiquitin-protein ligase RMA n=1 Tax=Forsythia ovata TaxID=205694 RepID=A0ABD1VJ85_9LAMI
MAANMDCGMGESTDPSSSAYLLDAGNFECNICFELAQEPIVTLCGHLYCWPCLCQWLQVHSHSQECPVCKALVQEEKLVPIYGRGKTSPDPRSRPMPITIPSRPMGMRPPGPETAPRVDINYFRHYESDPMARFGNSTLSTIFGSLPAFLNFQAHGFNDATVYGATSGVPYLFSGSFHGGYAHGFHYRSFQVDGKQLLWKIFFAILVFAIVMHLILC